MELIVHISESNRNADIIIDGGVCFLRNSVPIISLMENHCIHCLPNEVLIHIFSYIEELQDKLVIEQVCQHWKDLILAGSSQLDSLTASPSRTNTLNDFKRYLKVSGRYFNTISLHVGTALKTELGLVAQNCPNLKTLYLQFLRQSRYLIGRNGRVFSTILSNMPNLRALHIGWLEPQQRFNFDWRSINGLPQPISQLSVCGNRYSLPYACSVDLSHFPHLSTLRVAWFSVSTQMSTNLRHSLNITELVIHEYLCENDTFLKGISRLKNLNSLTLSNLTCISFNDEIVRGIIESCINIYELNLIDVKPDELTDQAFANVHQLLTLKIFNIQNMNSLTGQIFKKLVKLEKLTLNCNSVSENDVISFVTDALHLSILDFILHDWQQFIRRINSLMEARLKPLTLNVPKDWATMEWVKEQNLSELLRFYWDEG